MKFKSIKQNAKYWGKKAAKNVYKFGMGANTTISSKHAWGFHERFVQENAALLKEAEAEMEQIRERKRQEWLNKRNANRGEVSKADAEEYERRRNHIKSI